MELGECIREAAARGQAIYPYGGGTRQDYGYPPTRPGKVVDCRSLAGVIDYPARDMTITVQAGMTRERLVAELAREGQRLPVDLPAITAGTIGGALAANLSGPRRYGFGTLRDYVIGISFVTPEGIEVKGGGRVVKNVAGYDLMKLQIGALGTLGIITQLTLKVFPRPESSVLLGFGINAAAVGPTLDRLHASASRPIAVELLNAAAARLLAQRCRLELQGTDPWWIFTGFEEKTVTTRWQTDTLKTELKTAPVHEWMEWTGPMSELVWQGLTDLPDAGTGFAIQASIYPSRVAEFISRLAALHPDLVIHAHAGNGIVYAGFPEEVSLEQARTWLAELRELAGTCRGRVLIRRAAVDWKASLSLWGPPPTDWRLMRTIKATLDPTDLFNPGRLFGPTDSSLGIAG